MSGPLCQLCGNPKSQHRPEALARHSECTLESFTQEDPIEALRKLGIDLTPDTGLTPYHRLIVASQPIPGTKTGRVCQLECGHQVQTFGRLELAPHGKVLCALCKRAAEE